MKPDSEKRPKRPSAAQVAVLVVLTAVALGPVLFADFIRLDDYSHLLDNPQMRRMSLAGLARFWMKPFFNLYIPITYSVWWLATMLASLWGSLRQNAWLFHALSLAVHLVNATIVFFFVERVVEAAREKSAQEPHRATPWVAFGAAALFALHPVQVESVAWISELKGELAALFGLSGLLWHLRRDKSTLAVTLTALLFLAAMLSKPAAIVFPVIAWLVNRVILRMGLRRSTGLPALYAAVLLPLVFLTKHLQPDTELDFVPGMAGRLTVAADAFAFYLSKILVPFPLAVDYGRSPEIVLDQMAGARIVPAALVMLAAIAVTLWIIARPPTSSAKSLVACGWAIFFSSLLPVLGFIPFGFQQFSTVADHYLYVPILGVVLIAAGALTAVCPSAYVRAGAAIVVVVVAGLSFRQARLWRTTESLFSNTVAVNPRSHLGHYCIAQEQMAAGRLDEAIASASTSLSLSPNYLNAEILIGLARTQKGDYQTALDGYKALLAKNPSTVGTRAKGVASIHNNLGMLLLRLGRIDEAAEQYREAAALFPRSLNPHLNLGNLAFDQGRYTDAVAEYEIARSITPDNPAVEQRLARARQAALSATTGETRSPPP